MMQGWKEVSLGQARTRPALPAGWSWRGPGWSMPGGQAEGHGLAEALLCPGDCDFQEGQGVEHPQQEGHP